MTEESNCTEICSLRDYDWKLQHILGTSSLANYQESLLTLDFHISDQNALLSKMPHIKETVSVELNKDELDKLISVFESCQEKLSKSK